MVTRGEGREAKFPWGGGVPRIPNPNLGRVPNSMVKPPQGEFGEGRRPRNSRDERILAQRRGELGEKRGKLGKMGEEKEEK